MECHELWNSYIFQSTTKEVVTMPVRHAQAEWQGTLREGSGRMSLSSGAYQGPYSFSSRFEEGEGTNPEELIGAAHAGCFSMAFSADLTKAGYSPRKISTRAEVHLDKVDEKQTVTRIHLVTEAEIPGIEENAFLEIAQGAKENCPISRLLKGAEITLEVTLK
jgi:lipoyl-dependent peroxiredoxin